MGRWEGVQVKLLTFLTFAMYGGDWLDSDSGRLTLRGRSSEETYPLDKRHRASRTGLKVLVIPSGIDPCPIHVTHWAVKSRVLASLLADFSTLKVEAIRSSEALVHSRTTRRHVTENGILHHKESLAVTESWTERSSARNWTSLRNDRQWY
jgi:hypothetical protein